MSSSPLAPVALGLLSAATWGAGDFSGGLAARRASVYAVVIWSQLVGLGLLLALALLFDTGPPPPVDLAWGAAAGGAGAIGLLALYRGLSQARMGLVAPVSAIVAAILPVIVGSATEGSPGSLPLVGFALAVIGVWLLARPGGTHEWRPGDLLLPVIAGLGFGLFFILLDRGNDDAAFWPIVSARVTSVVFVSAVAMGLRQPAFPRRGGFRLIALAGVFDAAGNSFFTLAAREGRLDVASVLSSLYPASTVALAALLMKERLNRGQWLGVLFALTAVVLIAL